MIGPSECQSRKTQYFPAVVTDNVVVAETGNVSHLSYPLTHVPPRRIAVSI